MLLQQCYTMPTNAAVPALLQSRCHANIYRREVQSHGRKIIALNSIPHCEEVAHLHRQGIHSNGVACSFIGKTMCLSPAS